MEFRPCIDIHNGKVKQIVGGSLKDEGNMADENFVSGQDAVFYANLYKKEGFRGGHIILLNARDSEYYEATKKQAMGALQAYPGGLQIGGGITAENAEEILAKFDVIVDEDQVAIGADVLDDGRAVRIGFQEARDAIFKGLFAIGEFRAVLFVFGTDHRVDDGCVVFVKYFIPEIFSYGFVAFEMGRIGCQRCPHGQAADKGQGQA